MSTQIVIDHTGDSRFHFDPRDAKQLAAGPAGGLFGGDR